MRVLDLMHPRDGATYFAEQVWCVSLRYDLGDGVRQPHGLCPGDIPPAIPD